MKRAGNSPVYTLTNHDIPAMKPGAAYVTNSASMLNFTLPTTAKRGESFTVVGNSDGGWKINANVGQTVLFKNEIVSTFESLVPYGTITIVCTTDDVAFIAVESGGDTKGACPTGTIVAFAGTTAPPGFLFCDGSEISRTIYADLFTAVGTAWGQGNGSTTFKLPDMRGKFIRGRDRGSNRDADKNLRTAIAAGAATGDNVGSYQADDVAAHTHTSGYVTVVPGSPNTSGATEEGRQLFGAGQVTGATNQGAAPIANGVVLSTETRPNNIYFRYIIKT